MSQADVDIDFPSSFDPHMYFADWARATIFDEQNGQLKPHPCGYYPQNIPIDPISNLAAIPYKVAEELGFIKIDFLHLSIYDNFSSRSEIIELLNIEPDWNLLLSPSVVSKLFQLSNHFDIVSQIKPKNVEELADVLALIRPGKKSLLGLYQKDKESCRKILYSRDDESFSFKKSHAISYALVIHLQLHLISLGF